MIAKVAAITLLVISILSVAISTSIYLEQRNLFKDGNKGCKDRYRRSNNTKPK